MALVCFPEGDGDLIREEFWLCPVDRLGGLVVIAPARRAGDPGSNPGPGKNFSLKLLYIYICIHIPEGILCRNYVLTRLEVKNHK